MLVWEDREHKEWQAAPTVTDDGQYLILTIEKGTDDKHRVLYRPLDQPESKPVHLVGDFDADYTFIDNDGPVFWFEPIRTPRAAGHRDRHPKARAERLGRRDTRADRDARRRGRGGRLLSGPLLEGCGTPWCVSLTRPAGTCATSTFRVWDRQGFAGKKGDKETFYGFTSFTTPDYIFRYDVGAGTSKLWRSGKLSFDPKEYETTQVFYPSKDGTKIPMFLSYKKGLKRDGGNPTLLYGYGGFNIS